MITLWLKTMSVWGKNSEHNRIYLPNSIAGWFLMAEIVSAFARNHLQDAEAREHTVKWREDEYIFVFSGETHVQCLSLCIDLYYIKQAVPCQNYSKNKATVISSNTFNDVVYFLPSANRAEQSVGIYGIPTWFLEQIISARPALDRGTNLSFALRYPSNLSRMLLKEAAGKKRRDTCESSVHHAGSPRNINSGVPPAARGPK